MILVQWVVICRKEALDLMVARHSKCPNMDLVHVITGGAFICKLCTTLTYIIDLGKGIMTILVSLVHRVVFTWYFRINECVIALCISCVAPWCNKQLMNC